MKKMIMMLAAVAMAACAQAGEVRWNVLSSDAMGVYFIKGSNGLSVDVTRNRWDGLSPFLTTTLFNDTWTWSNQLAGAQVGDLEQFMDFGDGSFGYATNYDGTYFAFLVTYDDANLTPGGSFKVYIAGTQSQQNTFDLSYAAPYATGKFGGEAIPEPTSGLLLLLGMAGLALKRKVV